MEVVKKNIGCRTKIDTYVSNHNYRNCQCYQMFKPEIDFKSIRWHGDMDSRDDKNIFYQESEEKLI